jgi:hypothetical protein
MKTFKILVGLLLVTALSGCVLGRSVLDLKVSEPIGNPINGVAVRIVEVKDKRLFEKDPEIPETPSLSQDEKDTPEIRARAFARKRNGYGAAVGDVLLPEGVTVTSLVEKELANTFRRSGYQVLKEGDAGYQNANPIQVEVHQFWSWVIMGWGRIGTVGQLKIIGDLGKGTDTHLISNQYETGANGLIIDSVWVEGSSEGLKSLMAKVEAYLKT